LVRAFFLPFLLQRFGLQLIISKGKEKTMMNSSDEEWHVKLLTDVWRA